MSVKESRSKALRYRSWSVRYVVHHAKGGSLIAGLAAPILFCLPLVTFDQVNGSADQLIGLWASESIFVSDQPQQLKIIHDKSGWQAMLGKAQARFQVSDRDIRFVLPENKGSFRGRLSEDRRSLEGFWVQPPGVLTGQGAATPVHLVSSDGRRWRGTVRPLEDRFTLYLKIFRDDKGALIGAFRNPEYNLTGRASQFRVEQEGQTVQFVSESRRGKVSHSAAFARLPDRLRIKWPDLDRTIELTRRTPAQAPAFFPRPQGEPTYVYRKPPTTGDGWQTARAREVGIDEAVLTRIVQRVIDSDPAASAPTLMHSILIAHRGKLVLEEYFFGQNRDTPHDSRSAGKTFASVMLGATMMQGGKLAPETNVYDLLAGMGPFANPDPRKSRITLGHVMTHSTGLACDDNDDDSPGGEDRMQTQQQQPNWWKYTLDLPMVRDPGTQYAYCSGGINLAGAALTVSTGTWLPELFGRTVARPLEFGPYSWNLMPTGEGYLGGGASLRPRDLLKIGQVFLNDGVWNGRRIVTSEWVRRSTSPAPELYPPEAARDPKGKDGYAWHLSQITSGGRTYFGYNANGNGGQILFVVPELKLAVVFTGGNYQDFQIWGKWMSETIAREIIPAVKR